TGLRMRIGLIGPSGGDIGRLRRAAELLVRTLRVDQTIYLDNDDSMDLAIKLWADEVMAGGADQDAFITSAMALTKRGTAAEIRALLEAEEALSRLETIRTVDRGEGRAIEMLDDRIVLVVHDKGILNEDDIANAHIVVFGR